MTNNNQVNGASLWQTNVGTHEHPVSYLHEYAVAMIWEALHSHSEVRIRNEDGTLSDNLAAGMARVDIPDATTAIANSIPDLAIYDENHRPIRVVEVECSSKPNADKVKRLNNLGVDVIVAEVHDQSRLFSFIQTGSVRPSKANKFMPDKGELNRSPFTRLTYKEVLWSEQNRVYMPNMAAANLAVVNIPEQRRNGDMQYKADRTIKDFMNALAWCSPEVRREFCKMMFGQDELRDVHALFPISSANPKFGVLRDTYNRQALTVETEPASENLEAEFHDAMVNIYHTAAEQGYRPRYFLNMVSEHGGLSAAKRLINSSNAQQGLYRLSQMGLLHVSLEALILQERWQSLFTDDERRKARERLSELGYNPD